MTLHCILQTDFQQVDSRHLVCQKDECFLCLNSLDINTTLNTPFEMTSFFWVVKKRKFLYDAEVAWVIPINDLFLTRHFVED